MKNYKEMTDAVFRRRDEYLAAQKKKKAMLFKAGVPVLSLLLVVLVGVFIWQGGRLPEIPTVPPTDPHAETTASADVTADTTENNTEDNTKAEDTAPIATDPVEQATEAAKNDGDDSSQSRPTEPVVNGTLPPDPPEAPTQDDDSEGDYPATDDVVTPEPTAGTAGNDEPVVPTWRPDGSDSDSNAPVTPTDPPTPPMVDPTVAVEATEAPYEPTIALPTVAPIEPPTISTEPEPTAPPFTYPEESADGDLRITCDGRTYTANVGDTVTYVMEVWTSELFENFQGYMEYGEGGLEIIDRVGIGNIDEAGSISAPNLKGAYVNYYVGTRPNGAEQVVIPYSTNVVASNISPGYDFRDRKVLLKLEFIVTGSGEKNFDMYIVTMCKRKDSAEYFKNNEQLITDGIEIYEYILVN